MKLDTVKQEKAKFLYVFISFYKSLVTGLEMKLKKSCNMYVLLLLGMLVMFTGCFGGKDEGGEEVKIENEYSMILDKIVKDSKRCRVV